MNFTLLFLSFIVLCVKGHDVSDVSFWQDSVHFQCPEFDGDKTTKKEHNNLVVFNATHEKIKFSESIKGQYSCADKTVQFYVKGKGCPNCYDLNATFLGIVIGLDLAVTTFLMFIVHYFAKGRSPSTPQKTRGQRNAPQPPEPDYQPLNIGSRSRDTYAAVNRMG
ncbi:T-cell surface glycoprotein CD3 epsilon chain-like [Denticeps clupeoides]|uniref:T-cell surface glycoprotein CD3 epsilon chain-like n=1 Tax=Denticeps clupeoides TaxID=299321 RepID=UPI0010A3FB93|nr:T-cell surface glycoprotein CD3 epsilon chain-like [Denticeps clupeoides]XP_028855515.1 T-cell surface glycoprotein CD3 epsilon chain-like [Denticeps clupeoides]XP_028855516.1 T-cell surface glycoprotein CD3 epsilon chain-like [Denticeps clupeoides]